MRPRVSVIIPTHNRGDLVPQAVASVLAQRDAPPFELIVVDNASTDDTPDVLARVAAQDARVRIVRETDLGSSAARNAGVAAARGDFLFFTDDDVRVPPHWLATGMRHLAADRCEGLGGPVLPDFRAVGEPPRWFDEKLHPCLGIRLPEPRARLLTESDWMPYGANMAFVREALEAAGGFDPRLGRVGRFLGLGEESALFRRVLAQGGRVLFTPEAPVLHFIPPEHMRRGYFRRWRFDAATQRGRNLAADRGLRPRPWMLRRAAAALAKSLRLRFTADPAEAFRAELQAWEHLGLLRGAWSGRANWATGRRAPGQERAP